MRDVRSVYDNVLEHSISNSFAQYIISALKRLDSEISSITCIELRNIRRYVQNLISYYPHYVKFTSWVKRETHECFLGFATIE